MTEDEAKTKACCGPFAGRIPYGGKDMSDEIAIQGLDPDYAVEIAARWPCIGSACMAWLWSDPEPSPGFVLVDSPDGPITVRKPTAAHYGWPVLRDLGERRGFCGLAGRSS